MAPAAAVPGAAPPAPAPAAGQPPPFAVVTKDAQRVAGLFNVWRRDDRVWLELAPADFDKPFFLSPKLARGLGERWVYGGLMLSPSLVQWRRVHNMVQLMVLNTQQVAAEGTPEARALAATRPPSLLSSVPVVSSPHPERKSVLVDASAIFVSDMVGLAGVLQRTYRQGYGLEGRNSLITSVRGKPDLTVFEVTNHYATGSISVSNPGAPPGTPMPSVPRGLADPRSMLLGLHYSLARLPEQPMARRLADARVGTFLSTTDDYSNDFARSPRQRWVNRWRLEKKDPAAERSEPVKPITYWIDRNVPLQYRAAITAGILEWNKAFDKIGFINAIVVKQQPDDATWDTLDADVASVRWMVNREPAFGAIGPSHVDPRTGEILDADIAFESLATRGMRFLRSGVVGTTAAAAAGQGAEPQPAAGFATDWARLLQIGHGAASTAGHGLGDHAHCQHGDFAADQLSYAIDLLEARGELAPDGPQAQAFVQAYMKEVAMHEVGHTLGLRHNFRASRAYSDRQVQDPAFTATQAFSGSVMEYIPINLARPGEPAPAPFLTTLGPYDYWAIEYAYKPLPPGQEASALAEVAARSGEPELAYATDEDQAFGIDPDAVFFDLGDDPIAFAERRLDIAADLFRRQEARPLKPGENYASLRRSLRFAALDASRSTGIVLRQIGGLRTLRDHANTGRDPLQPVPAATQRAALALITQRVLGGDSFVISPALKRRLAPDFFERDESPGGMPTEFALHDALLDLRRAVLVQLMSDTLARRVLDNEARVDPADDVFRLTELYQRLQDALWHESGGSADAAMARRDLQREHVNRLAALLTRPTALGRSDARSLVRMQSEALLARLQRLQSRPGTDEPTRRHLVDSAESLKLALAARLERVTP